MIEQLKLFKLGGKIENRIVKELTLEKIINGLNRDLLPSINDFLNQLLVDDYTSSLSLKDDRVLKLYFNLLLKYPTIKDNAELIDMIVTKRYYERFGGENSNLIISLIDRYLDKIDINEEDYESTEATEMKVIKSINDIPSILLEVMPKNQIKALIGNTEIYPTLVQLAKDVNETPDIYTQDGKGKDSIVHLHYFTGNSDWFITEKNLDEKLFFGYVVLNGDLQFSEFGYISIDEITSLNVELDFHFEKMTIKEAITKYHG